MEPDLIHFIRGSRVNRYSLYCYVRRNNGRTLEVENATLKLKGEYSLKLFKMPI